MRSNFKFAAVVAAFFLVLCLAPLTASASGINVFVDGNKLEQSGVMVNGSTMVPMRGIFEALGATVVWKGATKTVLANRDKTEIQLVLGDLNAYVNGEAKRLSSPAASIGGLTMVPLRFIGEALGAEVKWDGATRTVNVFSSGAKTSSSGNAPTISDLLVTPSGTLSTGDVLRVELRGEPGCLATFDIPGVRDGIAMHEESSGRYIGELAIRDSFHCNSALLVARLRHSGSDDAALRQGKPISINPNNSSSQAVVTAIKVTPDRNASTKEMRPLIRMTFKNQISEGSLRFWLDNSEYSHQLTFSKRFVQWQPGSNLETGKHYVKITGTDSRGNKISDNWSFTINTAETPVNRHNEVSLSVNSPRNNQSVSSIINVTGKTTPKATVSVSATEEYGQVIGIISVKGRTVTKQATADENGDFNFDLDVSSMRAGHKINMVISATTTSGENIPGVNISVTRQ